MRRFVSFCLALALVFGLADFPESRVSANAASVKSPGSAMEVARDMKVGWNLGNGLDAYDYSGGNETAWGNPVITQSLIRAVKNAGYKTIRIPVTYMNRIGPAPDYTIDASWLDRVRQVVDYAMDEGLYTIINVHHDGNHDTGYGAWLHVDDWNQTAVRAKYRRVWQQIAEKFKNYGSKLMFESMNEVMEQGNYGTPNQSSTYPNINALNQICVDTVRASGGNNAQRYIIVPGYNTNIYSTAVFKGFQLPSDSAKDKLMVSVHYYDPYDFSLNESNDNIYAWGRSAIDAGNPHAITWHDEASVQESMQQLKDAFTSKGIPVVVGEFGAGDKSFVNSSNSDYRRYYYEYVTKAVTDAGGVMICWDNGWKGDHGLALFDRTNNTPFQKAIIDAMMRASGGKEYTIAQPKG